MLKIGNAPTFEDCVNVSSNYDYIPEMKRQCWMFKKQLDEQFPNLPKGVKFVVMCCRNNSENFYSVAVKVNNKNKETVEFTHSLKDNCPDYWNVGYASEISLNEFNSLEMSPLFKQAFGNTDERVMLAKIYTKEFHLAVFMDLTYYDDIVSNFIDSKDDSGLINYIRTKGTKYYLIKKEFDR